MAEIITIANRKGGVGKTRFLVKPNLMQMHSSYCVTDPNGNLQQGQRECTP